MKKLLSIALVAAMLFSCVAAAVPVSAATSGDYEYSVNDDGTTATVTKYNGTETNVVIPSVIDGYKITSIGNSAFKGCTSLESVTIPEGVTSIGNCAFTDCRSLASITIPEGVTSIGYSSFWGCTSLTSITIPEGVTSIGENTFYNCTSLASVTIPKGVTSIVSSTFEGCTSLTSVTIPEGVTSIERNAFNYCISLASVTIPASVTSIERNPFSDCKSLECINVDINNEYYSSEDGVLFNKDKTLLIKYPIGNTRNNYFIPDGVTNISVCAFSHCISLASITIPECVTSIGGEAFYGCTGLTSVTIPEGVTSIGYHAFYGCDNLVIYGYSGTAAETYASDNRITFIPFTELIDSENNISVSGIIPEETQLKADIISTTDTRVTYDITLTNNGEEIQPGGTVTVKIPVPAGMDGADCRVYREEASGSYTDMNAVYEDGFMVFTTEHFSKYVITSEMLGVVIGDVNGDGVVTLKDILIARKYVAGVASLADEELSRGDVNGDGVITLKDVLTMRKMVAGVL